MKKSHNKTIIQPVRVLDNISLAIEESIHDHLSWTAAMPQGDLTKLKKVCKAVSTKDGLTIWVLDSKKVSFIQE
jgi:hypothetical protein|tara:strand:+ start:192 stop:413 length:222 start_codon:yes stop_codon:yes gene_type:complete